jgi:hypothetical protein
MHTRSFSIAWLKRSLHGLNLSFSQSFMIFSQLNQIVKAKEVDITYQKNRREPFSI